LNGCLWIKQANKAGTLKVKDPVFAGKQFLALIENCALWPQLYDYYPVSRQKSIVKIYRSRHHYVHEYL